MSAYRAILALELRRLARAPSSWVYGALMLALGFLVMVGTSGALDSVSVSMTGSQAVFANSPSLIAMMTGFGCAFGLLIALALAGQAGYGDFAARIHPLLFSAPISRAAYLAGRYSAALVGTLAVFSWFVLGLYAGTWLPGAEGRIGPSAPLAYALAYGIFAVPDAAIFCALFFSLAVLTRSRLAGYATGMGLLLAFASSGGLDFGLADRWLVALLDPFGLNALQYDLRYWTPDEQSRLHIARQGVLLLNRLLWLGVSGLALLCTLLRFRFEEQGSLKRTGAAAVRGALESLAAPIAARPVQPLRTPGARRALVQLCALYRRALGDIARNPYFLALLGAALVVLILAANGSGAIDGTPVWPVTFHVLASLGSVFSLFITAVIAFYSGELIWQERDLRVDEVVDVSPLGRALPYAAKLAALATLLVALQAVLLAGGIATQLAAGYTRIELGQYLAVLGGFQLVDYLLIAVAAFAIHVAVNHRVLAHLGVALFVSYCWLGFGVEDHLFRYAMPGLGRYSDMNGFGPGLTRFVWFRLYWAGVAGVLAVATHLLWVRGHWTGGSRLSLAVRRVSPGSALAGAAALALASGAGAFAFHNTHGLHTYRTERDLERIRAQYEERYRQHRFDPQPRVTSVSLALDLFPQRGDLRLRGHYALENRSRQRISVVHLGVSSELEIRSLRFDRVAAGEMHDAEHGFHSFGLQPPLEPGEKLELSFDLEQRTRGFENAGLRPEVVRNGSFLDLRALSPQLGYNPSRELEEWDQRRRHGLGPRRPVRSLYDPGNRLDSSISRSADWIPLETIVSTDPDQIAVAPGSLQREWTADGRRHFQYRTDAPVLFYAGVVSARYAVRRDVWRDVPIEIYHHEAHTYNLDRMMRAAKAALEYCAAAFGPYPHRQLRILEFPRYEDRAEAFAGTVPFSEGIGFITRVREGDIDLPFYVTAHEVAHQWWGHQIVPANMEGSGVLIETLAQHSALMVMEREYGAAGVRDFLAYELDRYLRGRAGESGEEEPLLRSRSGYVHYNKGALAMYALGDLIGPDRLAAALRGFLQAHRFKGPPYPNTRDLIAALRAATAPEHQPLIEDLFESVILHGNRAVAARAQPLAGGRYAVLFEFEARKFRAGARGAEAAVAVDDWLDIGVFDAGERPLYLQKHRIVPELRELRLEVQGRPSRAGIDPYHKRIDRNPADNSIDVVEESVPGNPRELPPGDGARPAGSAVD